MRFNSKNIFSILAAVLITMVFTTVSHAEAFKSPSLGGATGLISTPTSHTGWEGSRFGLDIGYHYLNNADARGEDTNYNIGKALLHLGIAGTSLEIGFTYDDQPDWPNDSKTDDILLNAKWEFTEGLAIGGNYQSIQVNGNKNKLSEKQIYIAATYPGSFFNMPAETTIVIGHTFLDRDQTNRRENSNIDFSMGFDLDFAPQIFKHYVHWISDFANYSYSTEPGQSESDYRGCFNTGLRLALMRDKKFKLNLDLIMTDALDNNRDWAAGIAFGLTL